MESQGKVRGFGSYTQDQLEQMRADLKISMPIPVLSFCASYYRTQERRDPAIDELKMIDCFFTATQGTPENTVLTDLYTNDAFVAQTYADLVEKRGELAPNATTPCSVAELSEVANAYLRRAGKREPAQPFFWPEATHRPAGVLQSEREVLSPNRAYRLRMLRKPTENPMREDLLILILSPTGACASTRAEAFSAFLEDSRLHGRIKQLKQVSTGGLLAALPSFSAGLWIEYQRLSRLGEPVPLSMMTHAYEGEYIVRVSSHDGEAVYKSALAAGLRAHAFASVMGGSKYLFAAPNRETFSVDSGFLNTLRPINPVVAYMPDEHPDGLAAIKYETAVTAPSVICATASCEPTSSYFLNAVDSLLAPIFAMAAAGCEPLGQQLTVAVDVPPAFTQDYSLVGEICAIELALYRVQAEFSVSLSKHLITEKENISHPVLVAFATATGEETCPSTYVGEGNHVYCLTPERSDNGLPDFQSVRKLLTFVSGLRELGVLKSARVLCRERLTDAIREMSRGELFCLITGDALVADRKPALAIMIETTKKIPAKKIGVVFKKQKTATAPADFRSE